MEEVKNGRGGERKIGEKWKRRENGVSRVKWKEGKKKMVNRGVREMEQK
jgi:hypothetical protein